MTNYIVTDSELTGVADVIRSKRGTSAKLSFPEEWKTAINAISSDGSSGGSYVPMEPYIEEKYDSNGNLTDFTLHGYQKLRAYLFYEQSFLTNPSLSEGLTSIGESAFTECTSLALTSLPESLTSIGASAFARCINLAITSLPDSLTSIDYETFNNCTSLALTSLPESLTSIGASAFSYCTSLTSITFKGTPTGINSSAFYGCTNLIEIKVPWADGAVANAPWGATNATITYNYTGA